MQLPLQPCTSYVPTQNTPNFKKLECSEQTDRKSTLKKSIASNSPTLWETAHWVSGNP